MTALASGDWTIAEVDYPHNRQIRDDGVRVIYASMTLATVGTYPSGGVPVPTTPSTWGLKREFKYLNIIDSANGNTLIPKYSATGNTIRFYQQQGLSSGTVGNLIELATTASAGTGGTMILYVEAYGS